MKDVRPCRRTNCTDPSEWHLPRISKVAMSHHSPVPSEPRAAGRVFRTEVRSSSRLPTVLLIDDDRAVRDSLCRALATERFDVVTAASGKDALERMQEHMPDLIITDLRMAPLTGWDLMLHLRERHPALPIFVVTAVPAKASGGADRMATRFFQKPVDIDALLMAIHGHLDASNTENMKAKPNGAAPQPDET